MSRMVARCTIALLLLGAFVASLHADVMSMTAKITRTMVVADGGEAVPLN